MARQQTLADQIAERLPKGQEKFVDDEEFVYFFHLDSFYRVPRKEYERIYAELKAQTDAEHEDVVGLGGLHIIGTERHEARRIDNQLRGRAGRQGDPGSSRFYLSLEDDLMRIFGSDRIAGLMQRLGMEEGVPIEHGMVSKAIERAQKQVEAQNFATRKHLLEYDDVMNKQRETVYSLRRELLDGQIKFDEEEILDTRGYLMVLAEELVETLVEAHADKETDPQEWDLAAAAPGHERSVRDRAGGARGDSARGHGLRRDGRAALCEGRRAVRGEGTDPRPRRLDPAPGRARHHAADRGRPVEGPPLQPRPPEGRDRAARATASAIRSWNTRRRASRSSRR